MLFFPNGLLQRVHEYLLLIQLEIKGPGKEEPDRINQVLHGHNNPLRALPKEVDFIVENLVQKMKTDLPKRNTRLTEINCVDLGPVKSAFNWENKRKYVDHGRD